MKNLLLGLALTCGAAHAERLVVKFKYPMSERSILRALQASSVERFAPGHRSGPFAELWVVEGSALNLKHPALKTAEPTFPLQMSSIITNPNGERTVADSLFSYQWALYNQEQTLVKEQDDIRNFYLKGVRGEDLNWRSQLAKTRLTGKGALVAIVDTGIDLIHPELVHALEKNARECEAADKTKDNDGNGFPGDCDGWNFTAPLNSDSAKNPQDLVGHGTHLAGIVAAKQDSKGISGLVPNLRLLPVKVLNDGETESLNDGPRLPMSERLARGIIYATDRGADVINLSLGWPRSLETDYLRSAVGYAITKGVLLVAAAGNNNSNEPIFPCALDGVICVGATTIDGSWAGFSNFGANVDVLAPGEGILSTTPTTVEPDLFNVPGYDIKNGTSQAAPYVAAALALLKTTSPSWSLDQLRAKLLTSVRALPSGAKYAQGGPLDLAKLLDGQLVGSEIRPQLKLLRQLVYALGEEEKTFQIAIKNIGTVAGSAQIRVESDSQTIEILTPDHQLAGMGPGESRPLLVRYAIRDLDDHGQINLRVTVLQQGRETSFKAEVPLVRNINSDRSVRVRPFRYRGQPLPVGRLADGMVTPLIGTVDELHPSGKQDFILRRVITEPKEGEEKGVHFSLFRSRAESVQQLPRDVFIKNATQLISLVRMDVNYDGTDDFVAQLLIEDGEKREIRFYFYDLELNPLFGDKSMWQFTPEVAVIEPRTLRYLPHSVPGLGKVAIPVFVTSGRLPDVEQDPSPWVRNDTAKRERIYFLVPEVTADGVIVKTRSLSTNRFTEATLERFNLDWDHRVDYLDMLVQSKSRFLEGKVDVLFSMGEGVFRKTKRLTISSLTQHEWSDYAPDNVRLEGMNRLNLLDLTNTDFYQSGDVFSSIYDQVTARLIAFTGDVRPRTNYVVRHDSKSDSLLGHLVTFKREDGFDHFMQSKSRLILVREKDGRSERYTKPILRFSFLPGRMLSELYYPIYIKQDDAKSSALYVDSTQITANRIHVLVGSEKGLIAPARHSLLVPNNCKALNPILTPDRGTFQYNLLCAEPNGWALKTLELK